MCDLLVAPKLGSVEGNVVEKQTLVIGEARGYADMFKRGGFAWENKAPGKNPDAAFKQLLNDISALSNPPQVPVDLAVLDRLLQETVLGRLPACAGRS